MQLLNHLSNKHNLLKGDDMSDKKVVKTIKAIDLPQNAKEKKRREDALAKNKKK